MRHSKTTSALKAFAGLAILAFTVSCSDSPSALQEPSSPQPGDADIQVVSNPAGAAALVLRISGGPVDDVRTSSASAFWTPTSDGALAVIVLGQAASGDLATVRVPDLRDLSAYRVTVVEASGMDNEPLSHGSITIELRQ